MCGILGKIYLYNKRKIEPSILKSMTDAIYHRGPDDEGFYIHNNIGLGFRRLSIIDLNTGHQPLANADNSVYIVFNGEIYNYIEKREILLQKGYVFKTATDTEVILHLYEEFGVECLKHLRGMFAFAIWDNNRQQLFCARDRFGIKPFYFYTDSEQFVFGSEIKAILGAGNIDRTFSYDALDSYLAFGYITSNLSIFKNIKKLQPGHYLLLSFENKVSIDIKRYWEIQFAPDYSKTENQWMEEIDACLSETVKLHMIADVPLGAFLSGGIDSSSVVAMMARNSNRPVKTFSIGFKEKEYNELVYAREVAKRYGTEHMEQVVEPESIGLLPRLIHAYDEPFADTSAIPTYYVSKLAREYVTVALSGDGGDELFAGYNDYPNMLRLHSYFFNFNSTFLNKIIWGNINRLIPEGIKGKSATYYLSKNKNYLSAYKNMWSIAQRKKLILDNRPSLHISNASESYKELILKNGSDNDFITNLQYLDLQTYMVDSVLTKVDRASMMNSLEVRAPFLDTRVVDLANHMPTSFKLNGLTRKYILKKLMEGKLPGDIIYRKKKGFGVPIGEWIKGDLKGLIEKSLSENNINNMGLFDYDYIRKILDDHYSGKKDNRKPIWTLFVFSMWWNKYNKIG